MRNIRANVKLGGAKSCEEQSVRGAKDQRQSPSARGTTGFVAVMKKSVSEGVVQRYGKVARIGAVDVATAIVSVVAYRVENIVEEGTNGVCLVTI